MISPTNERDHDRDFTGLLLDWRRGDAAAFDVLLPLVYQELRSLARDRLARERRDHTLQPTALVHEAWLRLVETDPGTVESRTHFFAAAAQAMRRILVEHARRRHAAKRGGPQESITLDVEVTPAAGEPEQPELLDVHRALEDLAVIAERQARLVELRYFGGLTVPEGAEVLGVSVPTAERDWRAARLWLQRRLRSVSDDPAGSP